MTTTQLTIIGSVFGVALVFDILSRLFKRHKKVWKKGDVIRATVTKVIDGDTLRLQGYKQSFRAFGIDAVERGERGYNNAKDYLAKICFDKKIICEVVAMDTRWNRPVVRCFLPNIFGGRGKEINAMMLRNRYVKEDTKYSKGFYRNASRGSVGWFGLAVVVLIGAGVYLYWKHPALFDFVPLLAQYLTSTP